LAGADLDVCFDSGSGLLLPLGVVASAIFSVDAGSNASDVAVGANSFANAKLLVFT